MYLEQVIRSPQLPSNLACRFFLTVRGIYCYAHEGLSGNALFEHELSLQTLLLLFVYQERVLLLNKHG